MSKFRKNFVPKKFSKLSAMLVAKKALRVANKVKKAVEVKTSSKAFSTVVFTQAGTVSLINGLIQGIQHNDRIGREIRMIGIHFRFKISQASANSNFSSVRVMVVQDRQQVEGKAPLVLDILKEAKVISLKKLDMQKRFRFIYDRVFTTNDNSVSSMYRSFFKKLSIPVGYSGPLVGDIHKNGVYLVLLGDQSSNNNSFTSTDRFWFTD